MKNHVKNKMSFEKLMYFDDALIERILNMMFVSKNNVKNKYYVKYNDISLMNLMFRFISNYKSTDITNDIYCEFENYDMDYELEFYICFIFYYYKLFVGKYLFNPYFVDNISRLIYYSDIESLYNPNKFKLHYRVAYTDTLSLEEEVSDSLRNYVHENLPDTLDSDIEKAIGIYLLLATKLRYAPIYTLTEDYYDTQPYFDVTLENNEVVCIQFAIIYYKLLEEYGIEANLSGDVNSHMYVNLNFGSLSFRADATRYGFYSDQFDLSDMTNLKYGFKAEGIYIPDYAYSDFNYIAFAKERLNSIITTVYRKMGLRIDVKDKFDEYVDSFQRKYLSVTGNVNKEDFDFRISILNKHFKFVEDNVENTQFYNLLLYSFFYDIADERMESITLYRRNCGRIELSKLLVIYDEDLKPYYYLYTNGKLVNYDVDTVVEIILNDDWCFKRLINIDCLGELDDDIVKKLMR